MADIDEVIHDAEQSALRKASAEIAQLRADLDEARPPVQVVRYLRALFMPAGDTPRFEALADAFYRDTGIMAPGKSVPMDWAQRWTDSERRQAWRDWHEKREAEALAWIDAVEKGNER